MTPRPEEERPSSSPETPGQQLSRLAGRLLNVLDTVAMRVVGEEIFFGSYLINPGANEFDALSALLEGEVPAGIDPDAAEDAREGQDQVNDARGAAIRYINEMAGSMSGFLLSRVAAGEVQLVKNVPGWHKLLL